MSQNVGTKAVLRAPPNTSSMYVKFLSFYLRHQRLLHSDRLQVGWQHRVDGICGYPTLVVLVAGHQYVPAIAPPCSPAENFVWQKVKVQQLSLDKSKDLKQPLVIHLHWCEQYKSMLTWMTSIDKVKLILKNTEVISKRIVRQSKTVSSPSLYTFCSVPLACPDALWSGPLANEVLTAW